MIISPTVFAISGLLNASMALVYGLYVFIKKRGEVWASTWFLLLTAAIAVWGFSYWRWLSADSLDGAHIWVQLLTIGSLFIPIFYLHWIKSLFKSTYEGLFKVMLIVGYVILVANVVLLNSPFVIVELKHILNFPYWPVAGPLYAVAILYLYLIIPLVASVITCKVRRATKEYVERIKLNFILLGTVIGFGSGLTNFPLWFEIAFPPYGTFFHALFPLMFAYASVRHGLFNAKAIGSEMLVAFMLTVLFIELLLAKTPFEYVFRGVFLIVVAGFGYLLIRSIYKEIKNREKGERLARYLANANARLRELDKQKTEFVSVASHQLRSPIAAIKGYASLIREGSYGTVPKKLTEPLSRIEESGTRIAIMVDDFLNVTRIEQGRMNYSMERHDICKLVSRVVEELVVITEKKGLKLELVHDKNMAMYVVADKGKLTQIFSNLIDNAIKYTQEGGIRITFEKFVKQKVVLIKITDTGIGIAPEEQPILFQKFNRASNANSANVLGTGLGLYIAREIIKAHKGWIHVSSPGVGKGSTFSVELPLADSQEEESNENGKSKGVAKK